MTTTLTHANDLYEVTLHGFVIARITCYLGGRYRQDVSYDDLPEEVKNKVLDLVEKAIKEQA